MVSGVSGMSMFYIIAIVLIAAWIIYRVYQYIQRKRYANIITEEDFAQGMRKAQVIDLREKNDFDRGHIMGARNIPFTMLKQRYVEVRSDLPVYLYDQGMMLSTRASKMLNKKGYKDISILKSGYARWTGKTKTKKY